MAALAPTPPVARACPPAQFGANLRQSDGGCASRPLEASFCGNSARAATALSASSSYSPHSSLSFRSLKPFSAGIRQPESHFTHGTAVAILKAPPLTRKGDFASQPENPESEREEAESSSCDNRGSSEEVSDAFSENSERLHLRNWSASQEGDGASSGEVLGSSKVTSTLVLMRHGESMWNDMKLFTGDVDIPLTEKGVMEALAGGRAVAKIDFDMIFTSRLMRSKQTALLAMTQSVRKAVPVIVRGGYHGNGKTGDENRLRLRAAAAQALRQAACHMIPVYADPSLNERCYGDLQGLNKEAAAREFGEEMVQMWRRSHDTRPPRGESLLDTWDRSVGFFQNTITPRLKEGHNVLLVAHGNVLRCIISSLSGLSHAEMLRLQVVTALPYTYSYDGAHFAQCCVLPPLDSATRRPLPDAPLGLTSGLHKGHAPDSLI